MQNKKVTAQELKTLKNNVAVLFARAKSIREVNLLFEDLLTPAEVNELSIRLEIVERLAKGVPQRQIAKDLGVSTSSTVRGVRVLLNPKSPDCKDLQRKLRTIIETQLQKSSPEAQAKLPPSWLDLL